MPPKSEKSDPLSEQAPIDVAANLAAVKSRIADAASACNGIGTASDPAEVNLVAVSKGHVVERIRPALDAGHRLFGENRVQEAQHKWPDLVRLFPDVRLHMIGPLQTNKAGDAVALFDAIETLDRPKLARALAKEFDKQGKRPDLFVQVNTGEEQQKAGVLPDQADQFIDDCVNNYGLPVKGLMCIPPVDEEPSLHFALLAEIAARNGLTDLSMGMSHDYEIAVAFGATYVRVGTAIFGARSL